MEPGKGTVGITPIFCVGGTASDSFTAATCASAGGVALSPGLVNIAGNGVQTLNFILPKESNRVAVTFAVNLSQGGSGSAGFNYIDLDFYEAPEPSTFLLLGSALAGLFAAKFGKAKPQPSFVKRSVMLGLLALVSVPLVAQYGARNPASCASRRGTSARRTIGRASAIKYFTCDNEYVQDWAYRQQNCTLVRRRGKPRSAPNGGSTSQ